MFRFTIRDVLWLTMVAGLACGWWVDHTSHEELCVMKVRVALRDVKEVYEKGFPVKTININVNGKGIEILRQMNDAD